MEKHPYLSSKTIQLIVLVAVALATPLTVLLLSEQQDIRQRAAEVSPTVAVATLAPTSPFTRNPTVYCLGSCPTIPVVEEAAIDPTEATPSPTVYCLGNCTTPTVEPTTFEEEPTIDPCTESAVAHTKNSDKRGWFQKFWEEFLKMIRSLIPGQPTTPTPEPSPAPTMGISPTPIESGPTEAIEPTIDPCAPTSSVPTEAVSPTEMIAPTEAVEPTVEASISAIVVPTGGIEPTAGIEPTEEATGSATVSPTTDPCLVTTEGTVSVQTWGHEHHKRSNGLISGFIEFFTELIRLIIELIRGGTIPLPTPTPTPSVAPTEPVEPTEAVEPTENPCAPTQAPTESLTPTNEVVPTEEASISATIVPTQVIEPTAEASVSATVAPTVEEVTPTPIESGPTEDPCLVTTEGTVSVQTWGHHHHERKHGSISDFMKFFIEFLRLLIELISGGRIPAPTPTPTPIESGPTPSLAPTEGVTPTDALEPTIDPCAPTDAVEPTDILEPTEEASESATPTISL